MHVLSRRKWIDDSIRARGYWVSFKNGKVRNVSIDGDHLSFAGEP